MLTTTDKIKFIQSVLGSGRLSARGIQFDVWCPFCAPGDRSKKKLSIRLTDDLWHCWTCENRGRSLVSLVKKFGTRDQLVEYVGKFLPDDKKKIDIDVEKTIKRLTLPDDFRLLPLASTYDPDVRAAVRYLKGRGIEDRDFWYYRLGMSDDPRWRRRVIVPSFDSEGRLSYYVGRAIDTQRKPKYDNPDADKLSIVFNEINVDWTKKLVLCEGVFDMFKCGENVVPLLGSSLNEESLLFNKIIANNTPIALALDADMFDTRVPKIAKKLAEYDVDVSIVDVRPFPDPGKMTREQFQDRMLSAKSLDWFDVFNRKLNNACRTSLSLR